MRKFLTPSTKFKTNFVILLTAVFGCLLGMLNVPSPCFAEDKIIAIVNDEVITQKDLSDFSNFMRMELQDSYSGDELEDKVSAMKSDLLNKLIEDRLILQEAKKAKIRIDEDRIKSRMAELKKRYPAEADFLAALTAQGLTLADIETRMREQFLTYLVIEAKVKSAIMVTPAEVTRYYQFNKTAFDLPEQREFEVIKTTDEALAQGIAKQLQLGHEYSSLVKDNSAVQLNKVSAYQGKELRKEIEEAVFALKENGVSAPVKIEDSFYVFKILQIIPPKQQGLTDVREKIHSILYNKKMQESLQKWLTEVKGRSYIKLI